MTLLGRGTIYLYRGSISLGWEAWLTPKTRPSICYLAKRGRSALKGVDINREPPIWGALGLRPLAVGVADLEIRPSHMFYPANLVGSL